MDPPKQQQQSTNSPPLLQPSPPQESSSEIQDSEFHTWFQEIFPGRQLPASFQPEQTSVPRKDSLPHPHLQSLRRSNPLPWHDSPERLLLRELYPHLDSQCTTGSASDSQQRNRVLATRPPRPPRPRRESQEENVLAPRPPRPRREEDNVIAPPHRPPQPSLQKENVLARLREIESQEENVLAPPPRQPLAQAEEEPVRSSPPASKCSPQCWFMFAVIFFVGFIICALVLVYLVIIYTLH